MNTIFTADEHFGHTNIIKYCNRPFSSAKEMDKTLILNHNAIVQNSDTIYHVGDFTMSQNINYIVDILIQLKGKIHVFVPGSHDNWMRRTNSDYLTKTTGKEIILSQDRIIERSINGKLIVMCHYQMTIWPRSHYGSYLIYGHSHGKSFPVGKQHDVGVDNNGYCSISFQQLEKIMKEKSDNVNLIKKERNHDNLPKV